MRTRGEEVFFEAAGGGEHFVTNETLLTDTLLPALLFYEARGPSFRITDRMTYDTRSGGEIR